MIPVIPGFFVRGIFESQLARLVLLHSQWVSLQPHPRSWWGYQVWCALCCQYWETCAALWSFPWEWCELDKASTPCVLLETWCTYWTVRGCDVLGLFLSIYWCTETCTPCRFASRAYQTQRRQSPWYLHVYPWLVMGKQRSNWLQFFRNTWA